jgi:hypothetical protein
MIKLDSKTKEIIDNFFDNVNPLDIIKDFEAMGYEFEILD